MAKSWIHQCTFKSDNVELVYDTLTLEEAKKLFDAICSDEIMPMLNDYFDVKLTYNVGTINDHWCRDLILWIEGPQLPDIEDEDERVRFLTQDANDLEAIRQFIKDKTGII